MRCGVCRRVAASRRRMTGSERSQKVYAEEEEFPEEPKRVAKQHRMQDAGHETSSISRERAEA